MSTRTDKQFDEWDMQDLSIGHKLREAKKWANSLETERNNAVEALKSLLKASNHYESARHRSGPNEVEEAFQAWLDADMVAKQIIGKQP